MSAESLSVLFVCTGNICRSPSAEGVFRALLTREGLADRIRVDSAGTDDYHVGSPPDPRSLKAARSRGYDLSDLRARQLTRADITAFDYLLAMDGGHLRRMRALAPDALRSRIQLFLSYAPQLGETDVPDPYYGGAHGFERVLDMLEAASEGFLAYLRDAHPDLAAKA